MKSRISPSLVISVLALFVALGGASYAAIKIPKNSVGTKQLKNRAVVSGKVRDRSLLLKDFKQGQIKGDAYVGTRPPGALTLLAELPLFTEVVETGTEVPAGNYLILARANIKAGTLEDSAVTCFAAADTTATQLTVRKNETIAVSLTGYARTNNKYKIGFNCATSGGGAFVSQANVMAIPVDRLIGALPNPN